MLDGEPTTCIFPGPSYSLSLLLFSSELTLEVSILTHWLHHRRCCPLQMLLLKAHPPGPTRWYDSPVELMR